MKKIFHLPFFPFLLSLLSFHTASAQFGLNWFAEGSIGTSLNGNNHPRIVAASYGGPCVIWYYNGAVMFSKWQVDAFGSPRVLSPVSMTVAGASWMGPDIASHGDTIYVVFKEAPEDVGHIWCMHSYDGGEIFSVPIQVDFTADSLSRFPTVTTDDSGNPLIAFMKFDPGFSRARWAVTRSDDFGNSFSPDVLASGWSSPTSLVCDCCPGSIVCSGNNVAVIYRDNNNNIRDTWAALSTDGGVSFSKGVNIDQQNWMISACPSSGPDAVIIGDTLYSTFMSAASGMSRVYSNHTSLTVFTSTPGGSLTESIPGLSFQNFPRTSSSGISLATAWRQNVNGQDQCLLSFSSDIYSGLPFELDTVTNSGVNNSAIAIRNGNIIVVWEDYNTGTVQFRWGTYDETTALEVVKNEPVLVFPNPSHEGWTLTGINTMSGAKLEVFDLNGQIVFSQTIKENYPDFSIDIDNSTWNSGIYFAKVFEKNKIHSLKLIKD